MSNHVADSSHDHSHGPRHYLKIYGILLLLFVISVLGPEIGVRWITLVTAFGIAIIKFLMVAAYFMHLNIEKKFIHYMLYGMLIFCGVFFAGTMVDIMATKGSNWENIGNQTHIEQNKERLEHAYEHEH